MTENLEPINVKDKSATVVSRPDEATPSVSLLPVNSLRPHPANARKHTRNQIGAIAASIQAFKFNSPLVIDAHNQVLAGHGRLEAAKSLGIASVPTVRVEHLSDAQARAFMLATTSSRIDPAGMTRNSPNSL